MRNKYLFIPIIIFIGLFASSFTIEKDLSVFEKKVELRKLNASLNKINIDNNEFQNRRNQKNYIVDCDNIILKNGKEISGKVLEVGITEIKYKKCDNLNGPIFTLKKSDILMIRYSNGTKDIFPTEDIVKEIFPAENSTINNRAASVEALGLVGFILSIVGLIILGIPLGLTAIILGAISLKKIRTNPKKFKGRGFAIVSIIIGIIDIVGYLILLALIL
ncbi:MAG: DUF4190 domain-containing protein [Bacteroidales bacterium]|nr:DUF4190 domain-containing protein [Bacteroidales bacterium]